MAIANSFERFYRFLANLGLVLRDDPPKVVDLTGRSWGPAVDGLALSIREIRRDEPGQQLVLSVVIRNELAEPRSFVIPGWLFFYNAEVMASGDTSVPLSFYGNKVLKAERKTERVEVSLGAGDAREVDLPVGALYAMRRGENYRVRVRSRLGEGALLASNEIEVTG